MGILSRTVMLVKGTKSLTVGGYLVAAEDSEAVDALVALVTRPVVTGERSEAMNYKQRNIPQLIIKASRYRNISPTQEYSSIQVFESGDENKML